MTDTVETFVGIDVSKTQFDLAVHTHAKTWQFKNTEVGIADTVQHLQTLQPTLIVLEATGGFELPLVAALAVAQLPVVVTNPRRVRDFARSTGRLAKTDQ